MSELRRMECPVCGKVYWSQPLDDLNVEELSEDEINDLRCDHCGWIYDLNQTENPDVEDKFNKTSLNEYKKWYENKLKENPNYDYFEEHRPAPIPHKCPVCGEYEFEDEYSYDICLICGWEDDNYFEGGGANDMSLEEAIADFKEKRKKDPNYKWVDTWADDQL